MLTAALLSNKASMAHESKQAEGISFNPTLREFFEKEDRTLLGLGWALAWRTAVSWLGIAVLIAVLFGGG